MDLNIAYFYMARVSWTTILLMLGALALYILDDYGILQRYTKKGGRYICIYGLILYLINLLYCGIRVFIYYI